MAVPKRGEIWVVDLDPTEGYEQRGTRPVLVISQDLFNRTCGIAVICPITQGGNFGRPKGFTVPLSGIKTHGVVLANQIRTLDLSARNGRRIEKAPDHIVKAVAERVSVVIDG